MKPSTFLVSSVVLLALAVTFVFVTRGAGAADPKGGLFWDEDVERYVRRKVATSYVDTLTPEQQREAFYRAMNGYVELDAYCEFIPPAKHKDWREDIEGKYAGLGVKIEAVDEGLALVGVFPGGPASKAGLRVGDTLTHANGTPLTDIAIEDVARHLKGKPDTTVTLRVLRGPRPEQGPPPGPAQLITVTRGVISRPTVFVRRIGEDGAFGQVRISDFAEETVEAFDDAVTELVADGVKGIVLDLRNNGGGVLSAALEVADRFLTKGLILRMEGRGNDANKLHRAKSEKDDVAELPLVVMIDNGSASASEVVAGALQDHRRALLVGERTYGKFLVQQISEIPGTKAAIKLTTSRYYTPAGRSYQADPHQVRPSSRNGDDLLEVEPAGLFPDVIEPLTDAQEETLLKSWLDEEGRVWNQEPRFPEIPRDHVDPQLKRAIDVLSGDVALRAISRSRPRDG